MESEEGWSSVSLSPVQEAGTIYQACQGTGLAQKVLECCKGFPVQLEGSLHAGCGKLQRHLAVLPLHLSQHQAMQHVEGSVQGLNSLSQQSVTRR